MWIISILSEYKASIKQMPINTEHLMFKYRSLDHFCMYYNPIKTKDKNVETIFLMVYVFLGYIVIEIFVTNPQICFKIWGTGENKNTQSPFHCIL